MRWAKNLEDAWGAGREQGGLARLRPGTAFPRWRQRPRRNSAASLAPALTPAPRAVDPPPPGTGVTRAPSWRAR